MGISLRPRVLLFAGQIIDPLSPDPELFNRDVQDLVRTEFRARLEKLAPRAAYCGLSQGPELILLETLLERRCDRHVVVPFPLDQLWDLGLLGDEEVKQRAELAASQATSMEATVRGKVGGGLDGAYRHSTKLLVEKALIHCRRVGAELTAVVMWEGAAATAGGVVSHIPYFLELCHARKLVVEEIPLPLPPGRG